MAAEKTLNPFDVEGLEKSLSDSATRVSTIWISYLLFGLYLLVSAGTATNKQLLLAEPVKLPALGTEVPLVAFFVISPLLFIFLQFYVLLQTLLLGRTARAYNDALNRTLRVSKENAIFRERLANTIFAQVFAGAPREREGWVGIVLRGIAWFTLIGSPILVLLTFQLAFLPYHSQAVTWIHRLLVYFAVGMAFTIWPVVINPAKEYRWYRLDFRFWKSTLFSWRMSKARETHRSATLSESVQAAKRIADKIVPLKRIIGQLTAGTVLLLSTLTLSFPGEWQVNLLSFRSLNSRACKTWITDTFSLSVIDRLNLKDIGVADAETLKKMIEGKPEHLDLHKAARSRDLSDRDFDCGVFNGVDFRLAALDKAQFEGSVFLNARLDGARMPEAVLEGADLTKITLDQIDLTNANLSRAILSSATLNKVELGLADLSGIDLSGAVLTVVNFGKGARLSGANLIRLTADELNVPSGHLEGVSLQYSTISKLDLWGAALDGADFFGANVPIDVSQYDKTGSLFFKMPPDWDTQTDEQIRRANAVADTVCAADISNTGNSKRVGKIVAEIIKNALYPRRGDPACPKSDSDLTSCPPEQPTKYRNTLADRLSACASKVLNPTDVDSLRSGKYGGNVVSEQ